MTGDPFGFLQRWYAAQCDGEWEHAYGVKIDVESAWGAVFRFL
ncbi:immunity 53 family protein [Microbispora sp. NBC_01189]|nr:immunity 53 family protein [Microbispora sp. NBC_01189]